MARTISRILVGLLLVMAAALNAQTSSQAAFLKITLGQSAVPLYAPWRFTIGDSPVDSATNTPLWAESGFDDSKWESLDLTPPSVAANPVTGTSGYVKGWTSRGHAGYWGYGWYRMRVQVDSAPGVKLAIAGPQQVDDTYQLFDNGTLIGAFGDFSTPTPGVYYAGP